MISAAEALERLREGNGALRGGVRGSDTFTSQARRSELVAGQEPFAVVLGCSDSRVPAEIVFDQGLGDLFVIRVAGNIVAASQIGSVEFAAEQFGTRTRGGPGPHQLRRGPGHHRRAGAAGGEPVAESAFHRRSRATVGGDSARHRAQT